MAGSNLRRQAARRDRNEAGLVHYLRERGAIVHRLSGAGVPDLLVGYAGLWWPVEVKQPRGTLTVEQLRCVARAAAAGLPWRVIRDNVECEQLLLAMRNLVRHPI